MVLLFTIMLYRKKNTEKKIKIGLFIFLLVLNFILLNKVTSNAKSEHIFEKYIRK